MTDNFDGAKAAVFIGERVLVYQRDDRPDVRWAGLWDFPGGGRDGRETPTQTLARELTEEFGLALGAGHIVWSQVSAAHHDRAKRVWFFVVRFPNDAERTIVFGDEGQRWALVSLSDALGDLPMVPSLKERLAIWVARG